jgi:DNA topoisomerase-1
VEKDFDEIAEGREDWKSVMIDFYKDFEPTIETAMHERSEYKVGERVLGTDPKSGYTVTVKIGRYGPMVQIGTANETEHPRFAQLKTDQSVQTITLDEALELFKLPRNLGEFEGSEVTIGAGRYGAYVYHAKKYVSVPKETDPLEITLDEAIALINQQRDTEKSNHLKAFEEDKNMEVMNGRFGPYIKYNGANYKLPRTVKDPLTLTYEQCKEIIAAQGEAPTKRTTRRSRK